MSNDEVRRLLHVQIKFPPGTLSPREETLEDYTSVIGSMTPLGAMVTAVGVLESLVVHLKTRIWTGNFDPRKDVDYSGRGGKR